MRYGRFDGLLLRLVSVCRGLAFIAVVVELLCRRVYIFVGTVLNAVLLYLTVAQHGLGQNNGIRLHLDTGANTSPWCVR